MKPELILARALYAADNTFKLLSERPADYEPYIKKAKAVLWAMGYIPKAERRALARAIRKME